MFKTSCRIAQRTSCRIVQTDSNYRATVYVPDMHIESPGDKN